MNARSLAVVLCAAALVSLLPADAATVQQADNAAVAPSRPTQPKLTDLETAIADLAREMAAESSAKPSTQPATQPAEKSAPVAAQQAEVITVAQTTYVWPQPWSMQYRTITTVVEISLMEVASENGPTLYYSQGSFVDPTDGRIYQFLLNDMGAMAVTRPHKTDCVVVFTPADRQLTESDIAAIVPLEWIRQTANQTAQQ